MKNKTCNIRIINYYKIIILIIKIMKMIKILFLIKVNQSIKKDYLSKEFKVTVLLKLNKMKIYIWEINQNQ